MKFETWRNSTEPVVLQKFSTGRHKRYLVATSYYLIPTSYLFPPFWCHLQGSALEHWWGDAVDKQ